MSHWKNPALFTLAGLVFACSGTSPGQGSTTHVGGSTASGTGGAAANAGTSSRTGGAGQFKTGGTYEHYYDSWVDQLWASNNITVAKPGANCNPIQQPTLSAACYRHVGLGALNPDGTLKDGNTLWQDGTTFYPVAPADYYAKFWHDHAQNGRAYGFPYDDVGGWSSYISHKNPQYMLVAIGW